VCDFRNSVCFHPLRFIAMASETMDTGDAPQIHGTPIGIYRVRTKKILTVVIIILLQFDLSLLVFL